MPQVDKEEMSQQTLRPCNFERDTYVIAFPILNTCESQLVERPG